MRGAYGLFRPGSRPQDPKVYVHRFIYENTVGPIPPGHEVDHVKMKGCTSTLCCNPAHLEAVTPGVNKERTRLAVCRSGLHALADPVAASWDAKGRRRGCLECKRLRDRNRKRA